jgi:histidine triad (HIT) family protein
MGCLFCSILEKKVPADVVFENEHTLAFRDIRPVAPTHVLIVPKRHVAAVHELTDADAAEMGHLLVAARKVADQLGLTAGGYRLVINDGEHAGQTVHHVHLHVLGGRPMAWPPG